MSNVAREIIKLFQGHASFRVWPVGSRVTCNPAPTDTDEDWLVLCCDHKALKFFDETVDAAGFKLGGSLIDDNVNTVPLEDRFHAFRLDDVNITFTTSQKFADRFIAATSVAKRLNLMDKSDRIALFQAVLYGNGVD